ncbi:hypothetical protein [Methylosinus sp. LW4]|uniref:hypothetical protein n=1 Tax=Methylosinus sp. LW4 TaxID=136993 RepID=UPI0003636D85|nr:hypothetical protein [Methylosinus sp. LW4]
MTHAPAIIREQRLAERMVGDPRVAVEGGMLALHACLYAAAMLRKWGRLPQDASRLSAHWSAPRRTVMFFDGPRFVAAFRIPDRVMDFDPHRPAQRLENDR